MAVSYVYARDRCVRGVETHTLFQVSELDAQLVFLSQACVFLQAQQDCNLLVASTS